MTVHAQFRQLLRHLTPDEAVDMLVAALPPDRLQLLVIRMIQEKSGELLKATHPRQQGDAFDTAVAVEDVPAGRAVRWIDDEHPVAAVVMLQPGMPGTIRPCGVTVGEAKAGQVVLLKTRGEVTFPHPGMFGPPPRGLFHSLQFPGTPNF